MSDHPPASPPATAPALESVVPAVQRASTLLFASAAHWRAWRASPQRPPSYGSAASSTVVALEARVAALERGLEGTLFPSGMGAIAAVHLTALQPGDQVLLPSTVYPSHRQFALSELPRRGISVQVYDPTDLATLQFTDATAMVWAELPSSLTFEVPDLPAICGRAREHGAFVALDTTWGAGVAYAGFDFDIDFAVQSLSKFASGTSEVVLGSVVTREPALADALRACRHRFGLHASPVDAATTLAGLASLPVRYRAQDAACRAVAAWLQARPEVALLRHPALETTPGHAFWRRDCRAAAGILGVFLRVDWPERAFDALLDNLRVFRLGFGWGGACSLAMPYAAADVVRPSEASGQLLRLAVGLDEPEVLIADLAAAFAAAARVA